jgi:DNA primase
MKNVAETVRFSADIVRVVSDYVPLRGRGANLKGLCPFHSEKTPSFSVHVEKQVFHCFGCGVGGDVFRFVMEIEKVSFGESVRIVAEKCGIPLPKATADDDRVARERNDLIQLHERAARYFAENLGDARTPDARLARKTLEDRGVRPESVARFGLGYAPPYGLLRALEPPDPEKTGLFLKNDRGEVYERFRRRLMFPIWNERGAVIAFGGRVIGDGQPKYLNSPESSVYSKSYVLYGAHLARDAARKAGKIVVVEGYFDVLSLHQNGIENVVASCGTSLTPQQVGILARYVPEVIVNYDPDAAGQKAARRTIELLLERDLTVRILRLPGGMDPDEFVRKEGAEAYRRELEDAPYFWDHLVDDAEAAEELDKPEVRARVVGEILGYVRSVSDRLAQIEITRSLAERFRLPPEVLIEQLRTGRQARMDTASGSARKRRLSDAEKQIIHAVTRDPSVAGSLDQFLVRDFLVSVWSGRIIERLIRNPQEDIERLLDGIDDDPELVQAVRGATLEPLKPVSLKMAVVSMGRLYEEFLLQEQQRLQEQVGTTTGPRLTELLARISDIAQQKVRLRQIG